MGGAGLLPEYLHKSGVKIILCAGIGHKSLNMFESYGVQVFAGAKGTSRETLTAWENGLRKKATIKNICSEHDMNLSIIINPYFIGRKVKPVESSDLAGSSRKYLYLQSLFMIVNTYSFKTPGEKKCAVCVVQE